MFILTTVRKLTLREALLVIALICIPILIEEKLDWQTKAVLSFLTTSFFAALMKPVKKEKAVGFFKRLSKKQKAQKTALKMNVICKIVYVEHFKNPWFNRASRLFRVEQFETKALKPYKNRLFGSIVPRGTFF